MGGYGSGGHNKTHRQLENLRRIDSFSFYDYLKADKYLFCKETVKYPLIRGDIVYYGGGGDGRDQGGKFLFELCKPAEKRHG